MALKTTTTLIVFTLIILSAGCISDNSDLINESNVTNTSTSTFPTTPVMTPTPIIVSTPTPPVIVIPEEIPPIDTLINDLIVSDPGNRNYYKSTGNLSDLNTYGMMCVAICRYIITEYNYTSGIVLLQPNQGFHANPFVWVVINNSKYIIDASGTDYMIEDEYIDKYNNDYGISFVPLKKGEERLRSSYEFYHTVNESL